jgi:UDP-glucuronate 4-epimerase
MAPMIFARSIMEGHPINVFNGGEMRRDFTYVDDIVEGVLRVADCVPAADPEAGDDPAASPIAPYRVFNIGNGAPVDLMRFIDLLEEALGRRAEKNMLPMQAGDVKATWAETSDLQAVTGWKPQTPIEEGIERFVTWYREFYAKG